VYYSIPSSPQLLLYSLIQLPCQFRIPSQPSLNTLLRDRPIVGLILYLQNLLPPFRFQLRPFLTHDWRSRCSRLIPGAPARWRCQKFPRWHHHHDKVGMSFRKRSEKIHRDVAWVNAYECDAGIALRELDSEQYVDQF